MSTNGLGRMGQPRMDYFEEINRARQNIASICIRTPLVESSHLSSISGSAVYLKLESLQHTGSYKIRGAANRLMNLSPEQRERGVIAYSTGNHGLAVAYVAKMLNIRAVICVSEKVSTERTNAIKRLKAEVIKHGEDQDQAGMHASLLAKEEGLTMIRPFDDPYVIAGQGTIGLELLEDLPEIGTVIVPLAGGGLVSGIAIALKSAKPNTRIIGVSAGHAPSMAESVAAGRPVEVDEKKTIACSLEGSIGLDNRHTFSIVKDLVDEVLLASEAEIEEALSFMIFRQRLVVEGAAAVGPAMLLNNRVRNLGENTVIVMSGGSLDSQLLLQVANRGIEQSLNEEID